MVRWMGVALVVACGGVAVFGRAAWGQEPLEPNRPVLRRLGDVAEPPAAILPQNIMKGGIFVDEIVVPPHGGLDGVFIQPQRVQLRPNSSQVDAYWKRLKAYLAVREEWAARTLTLSESQSSQLAGVRQPVFLSEMTRFAGEPLRRQTELGENFPTLFSLYGSTAEAAGKILDQALGEKVLTAEQVARLTAAMDRRAASRSRAFQHYALSILDEELYLSDAQREQLARGLSRDECELPYFAFLPQTSMLPQQHATAPFDRQVLEEVLTDSQETLLRELQRAPLLSTFVLDDSEASRAKLADYERRQQEIPLSLARVRLDYFAAEELLTEAQLRALETAAKGSAVQAAREQVAAADHPAAGGGVNVIALPGGGLVQFEAANINMQVVGNEGGVILFGNGQVLEVAGNLNAEQFVPLALNGRPEAQLIMGDAVAARRRQLSVKSLAVEQRTLDNLSLWSAAFARVVNESPESPEAARLARLREARSEMILELLDSELWLAPDQKDALRPLVAKTLPRTARLPAGMEHSRELVWLAHPLTRLSNEEVSEILTAPQLSVWTTLRTHFRVYDTGRACLIDTARNGPMRLSLE